MKLVAASNLVLPRTTTNLIGEVSLELCPGDGMYDGNPDHYLYCGASALSVILSAIDLAAIAYPSTILDFGAGAGRVTRWLRAAFPAASIDACDLREHDMTFCREAFSARTWISGTDIDLLQAPGKYDLIWLGSVATHLSSEKVVRMLDKALSWTSAMGLVLISFHGAYALSRQESGEFRYIDDASWSSIKTSYHDTGFGYADYRDQPGYGISLTKLSWIAELIESRSDVRLVALAEKAWDGHHDILAIQSVAYAR